MRLTGLARVSLAFAALGLVLVSCVVALLSSAVARLEEQRTLRHRMVAERVFDEVEREIGSVLQHEAARPSAAYDSIATDPARWSRFIVGYYRRDPELILLAEPALAAARAARLREALQLTAAEIVEARARSIANEALGPLPYLVAQAPTPNLDELGAVPSSPDVLRQLNRGVLVREHRMHDFNRSFAVAHTGTFVVAERLAADNRRSEGLVIDVRALVESTQAAVLGSQNLRSLAALGVLPDARSVPGRAYRFEHRLAAPFDAYTLALALARLDDQDASSALYGFAALFALAAALGSWALYRTVLTELRFAERRNNFVSAVTHELRTPLTSIRMYGEMLRDGMVQDEAQKQEYYATITAEGERLTRLINNVMEHGRLRRGQRRAHLEQGDASLVVREVVELMRPHIEREGFSVSFDSQAGLPAVQYDVDGLKQVLFNVFDNALKYARGHTQHRIDLACVASGADRVSISVRDYGPGVQHANLEQLFEAFFRGESELTRRNTGTGLGLALVRDLVELMHGSVEAKNRDPGFEIRVTLRAR
jgi:signal transduction histidine kinase